MSPLRISDLADRHIVQSVTDEQKGKTVGLKSGVGSRRDPIVIHSCARRCRMDDSSARRRNDEDENPASDPHRG